MDTHTTTTCLKFRASQIGPRFQRDSRLPQASGCRSRPLNYLQGFTWTRCEHQKLFGDQSPPKSDFQREGPHHHSEPTKRHHLPSQLLGSKVSSHLESVSSSMMSCTSDPAGTCPRAIPMRSNSSRLRDLPPERVDCGLHRRTIAAVVPSCGVAHSTKRPLCSMRLSSCQPPRAPNR